MKTSVKLNMLNLALTESKSVITMTKPEDDGSEGVGGIIDVTVGGITIQLNDKSVDISPNVTSDEGEVLMARVKGGKLHICTSSEFTVPKKPVRGRTPMVAMRKFQ